MQTESMYFRELYGTFREKKWRFAHRILKKMYNNPNQLVRQLSAFESSSMTQYPPTHPYPLPHFAAKDLTTSEEDRDIWVEERIRWLDTNIFYNYTERIGGGVAVGQRVKPGMSTLFTR